MPIYEYRCDNGHVFEVMQRMIDDPVTACETCQAPVQRVFHPIAVHFKGSGFYNTDYGTRNRSKEKEAGEKSSSGSEGKSEAKKDSSDSKSSKSDSSSSKSDSPSSSSTKKSDSAKKSD